MRTTNLALALFGMGRALHPVVAKEQKPFAPVEDKVKEHRTRRDVRWEQDLAAREESRNRVGQLLKRPLTLSSAVQVALLNNRGLQATLKEIGLSFADVREARTLRESRGGFVDEVSKPTAEASALRVGPRAEFSRSADAAVAHESGARTTRRRAASRER